MTGTRPDLWEYSLGPADLYRCLDIAEPVSSRARFLRIGLFLSPDAASTYLILRRFGANFNRNITRDRLYYKGTCLYSQSHGRLEDSSYSRDQAGSPPVRIELVGAML